LTLFLMKSNVETLAGIIDAKVCKQVKAEIRGVSIDSRTIQPGDCFFAIKGEHLDGHNYIAQAFAKGAVCGVVNADYNVKTEAETTGAILKVSDTVKALGDLAGHYRRQMDFKVVAITGSAGKSTTKEMTYHVLSERFSCYRAPKSYNNNIGLPLTLLAAEPENEIVIVELGSNSPGEIATLSRIAQPDIAIITNIYPAHLAGFGSIKAIIEEKTSISQGLRTDGVLIINGRFTRLAEYCRDKGFGFVTFGTSTKNDIAAEDVTVDGLAGRFRIEGTEVIVLASGRGNIENALAAWAICKQFGLSAKAFASSLETFKPMPMRLELMRLGPITVLNDCYNANPASMKNALESLAHIGSAQNGRLVFICGAMMELAGYSQSLHTELGAAVAQAGVKLLLAGGEFAETTARTAKQAARYNFQAECFADTACICNSLEKFIKPDDIILVKGSRAAKLEDVVERLKEIADQMTIHQ